MDIESGKVRNYRLLTRRRQITGAALLLLSWSALPTASIAQEDALSAGELLTGFTAPMQRVTLAPVQTGRIADISVAEGEVVPAGTLMLQLDDRVQVQRVAIARALAESTLEIELAKVRRDQAARELERLTALDRTSAASSKELSDAQANAAATAVELAQAEFQHTQAQREYELQRRLLDELSVRAPFDGYIAERLKEVGDTVEEREGVFTLVQLDPLEVTFDCPLDELGHLQAAQHVLVARPDDGTERVGEVAFVSRVAHAASQTAKVKLHVPNADSAWIAGMRVHVDLAARPTAAQIQETQRQLRASRARTAPRTAATPMPDERR